MQQRAAGAAVAAADMNIVIALCIAALHQAAPHASRSVEAHHSLASREAERASLEAEHHTAHDNIAELLIPLLKQSLDNTHDGKHKKVIQVLPYEDSQEHENKGWRKLKSNKKQLVEITPLRRRVGNNKHLAYILSSAKPVTNVKDSATSEENSFEDSVEPSVADVEHRVESSEDNGSNEMVTVVSDKTNNIDVIYDADGTLDKQEDLVPKEYQNDEDKEIKNTISDKNLIVDKSEKDEGSEHFVQDSSEDAESSGSVDSRDLQFGPGNNILFDRGSSESALQGEYGEDANRSDDVGSELGGDEKSSINVAPGEAIGEKEVTPDVAQIEESEVEAQDSRARDEPADSSGDTNNLDTYKDVEKDFTINRRANSNEFEGKSNVEPKNSRSREVIEVLETVEEQGRKYNCDKTGSRSREHKSYRLSFLFNK